MKLKTWFFVLVALVACRAEEKKETDAAKGSEAKVPVKVAAINERRLERTIELSGSLIAPNRATIAAEVEGKVITVAVDLGDRVRAGSVLARVDSDEYHLRFEQAEAERAQAEANLLRVEALAKSEMVAPAQLDDARAQALQLRAAAGLAKKKFENAIVVAAFSGAVQRRLVSPGEYVKPGQALFELVAQDPLEMSAEVPERFMVLVKLGDPITVTMDAFPGENFRAKIGRISPAINPQSRSFSVQATVDNRKGLLKAGVFAKASLQVGADDHALVVPEAALATMAGINKVYLVEGTVAREKVVTVLQHMPDGIVAVSGDLKAGQNVAVSGLRRLADGVEVSVQ